MAEEVTVLTCIRISDGTPIFLIEDVRVFSQSFQANSRMLTYIRPTTDSLHTLSI
jgi:hypothetical protein